MKEKIMRSMDELEDYVSFADLKARVEGFQGPLAIVHHEFENIVIWAGVSWEFHDAMNELMETQEVFLESTTPLTYIIDGLVPSLPVAKSLRNYNRERWFPMVIRPGHKMPVHLQRHGRG